MIRRLFDSATASIASAAALVAVLSFGSRLLGLVRDRLLASTFGAGDILDAYYAAFRIPDFIFSLIVLGALSAGFIPVFTKLDSKRQWQFANAVLSWLFVVLGGLAVLFVVFAPSVIRIITPGFSGSKLALTITLARIMALSPVLLGVSNVFGAILQSKRRFFLYALSPVFYNIGIIGGILFFVPWLGAQGLAWGVVVGAALHVAIQAWGCRVMGFRFTPLFEWSSEFRRLLLLSSSRIGGTLLSQLDLFVATVVATTLAGGSLTIFQFANNIQILPVGLIGIPFALAAFPVLSEAGTRNPDQFRRELTSTTLLTLFFILPSTVLLLLLRAQVVRIVFGGSAFDWNATIATFHTLQWFAVSLFAQSLIPLFARALYALESAFLPLVSGIVALLVSIAGYCTLTQSFGVQGLALAASAGFLVQCTILYIMLQQKIHAFDDGLLLRSLARLLIAAVGMAGWIQMMKVPAAILFGTSTFVGVLFQMVIAGGAGTLAYTLLCWLLGAPELTTVVAGVRRRLVRQALAPKEVLG